MVEILIFKAGDIPESWLRWILHVMEECYRRLEPHGVDLVNLYLFKRCSSAQAFLRMEGERLGISVTHLAEGFFALHDAWTGIPRITICVDRMGRLPSLVQLGGIRHEVGHSILHGSPEYYAFPPTPKLMRLAERLRIPQPYITSIVYLVSLAVKDYEVSRLLHRHGYLEDQVAYAKHLLSVSEEDLLAWRLSSGNPLAETLCIAAWLKGVGCALPFIRDKRCGGELTSILHRNLSSLPKASSGLISSILNEFPSLGDDTFENVSRIIDLLAERVLEPFSRHDGAWFPGCV